MKTAVRRYISNAGSEQSGYILFMVLFVMFVVSLVGVALIVVGTSEVNVALRSKMMEQAYSAAEAGVNRAVVYVANNSSVAGNKAGQWSDDPHSPETWQWGCSENLPGDPRSHYNVEVHYDTKNPTESAHGGLGDSFYKLVISTGTYTWGGKSVDRTIEAKLFIPAGYQEVYDEAFDFNIFNGLNTFNDESGNWPSGTPDAPDDNTFVVFNTGRYIFDGVTEYGGRAPKGVVYTRGNIQLEFESGDARSGLRDRLVTRGNVVASNDLTIQSAASHYTDIDIGDRRNSPNLVAGVDGNGSATITTSTGRNGNLKVWGTVSAADDITITGTANSRIQVVGGLFAGGNVLINRSDVEKKVLIGPIVSCGSTVVNNIVAGATVIDSIYAGSDPGETGLYDTGGNTLIKSRNLGVGLVSGNHYISVRGISPGNPKDANGNYTEEYSIITSGEIVGVSIKEELSLGNITLDRGIKAGYGYNVAYPTGYNEGPETLKYGVWLWFRNQRCKIGNIQSNGRVSIETESNNIVAGTGDITAGTDGGTPPVGVYWRSAGKSGSIGNTGTVTSAGGIQAVANGDCDVNVGVLKSGGDINLTSSQLLGDINVDSFEAFGGVTVNSGKGLTCPSAGTVKAMGNVSITAVNDIKTASISSNGAVSLLSTTGVANINNGNIVARGNVSVECADGTAGTIYVDGIWGNTVNVTRDAGTGTGYKVGPLKIGGNTYTESIRAPGQVTLYAAASRIINVPYIRTDTLPVNKTCPGTVNVTSATAWGGELPGAISVSAPAPPLVPRPPAKGHGTNPVTVQPYEVDVLSQAHLDEPVRLPEPNWWHFMQEATKDDEVSPTPPHMIYDGGVGDTDGTRNGVIQFLWRSGDTGYSTNETVYQDDPSVTVNINVSDWTIGKQDEVDFKGTLVAKGPVLIDASGAHWRRTGQNIMNVISGGDITFDREFELNNVRNVHFHLYATNNIVFKKGHIRGGSVFYGSFTAGNKVIFHTDRIMENCTFRWSRWDIDPAGWMPEFKVLSWREV